MRVFDLSLLLLMVLFFSCKNNVSKTNQVQGNISNTNYDSVSNAKTKNDLKISAYLVYDDGTLSSFDVLNDKTIALWNAVAGGGDVPKPSNNTKVSFVGNLDSSDNVTVIKNKKTIYSDTIPFHCGE
jgi:hypothetical protein